jgi:hypothetical protein
VSNGTTTVTQTGGIGFCGALALVFITLKLLGVIAWSWWWVLAPIWIPFALVVLILAFGALFIWIASALK